MGVPGLQPFKAKVMSFGHSACFATHQQAFRQYLGESTHDAMLQEVQIGVQVYQFDNRKKALNLQFYSLFQKPLIQAVYKLSGICSLYLYVALFNLLLFFLQ